MQSTPNSQQSYARPDILGLPFDQYQRYHLIQEVIDSLRWQARLNILDVGGSPAALCRFLPSDHVVVADTVDQGGLHLYANGLELPFGEAVFDIVVTADTLEHVPSLDRLRFLTELSRVSRDAVIVGAPFNNPAVVQAEEVFQSLIWARYGEGYHFIEEHRRYGLPKLNETAELFRDLGYQTAILPNGYLHRWLVAISTFFLLQWRFHDADLNARANAYYNANFYRSDNRDPSYRKIIVASRTRDVSGLRVKLCSEPSGAETDEISHSVLLGILVNTLTESWSGRAQSLEVQLAEKDKVIQEMNRSVQILSGQLNTIYGSKLWRAGAWYRGLLQKLRGTVSNQ